MTNKKSNGSARSLDTRVAQTHHRGSTVGKNMPRLVRFFRRRRNTNGIALVNWIDEKIQEKYGRKFSGSIDLNVSRPILGRKAANPKPGQVYESMGAASISGQDLRRVKFPITLTLYQGGSTVSAGYTLDSRVQFEGEIGSQQLDSALVYVPMLNEKGMERKLRRLPKPQEQARARKAKKSFDNAFAKMPEEFVKEARKNKVDLDSLKNPDLLRAAPHLADQYWSALVWAFQTKGKNELNWLKGEARKNKLPHDVRTALYTREKHPHLMTRDQYMLLGAYRIQARKMPRRGIAGDMPDELLWLANSRKADSARKAYGREVNLSVDHEPARFYSGKLPEQQMTVGEKLNDPYWTMADLEGVLRKFPLTEFRRKVNTKVAESNCWGRDRFYRIANYLTDVRDADKKRLKRNKGDLNKTHLGENYNFVDGMLKQLTDPKTKKHSFDRLMDSMPMHLAEKDIQRFHKVAYFHAKLRDSERFNRPAKDYFA